ncbi:hypothetical protein FRACYDRAFT_244705 [Fragilariopsis cylindrus CCMP1102]|uniref:RING-type domain-containing protein n=1 Tax=Fragilariopsis cylindrus CCMP1102 TaxID=635003 RepID=A0A1E7F035_9STRA|nr:hypothetical protein FRACYDRAFT_244705 [Fragilariopsis cylindrus CCMP1102]|eukprot:OEU11588.1 hypothetical protein FRACYDRAFT_244705 [Fragilariopsis cylindrus CCMP1102]
MSIADFCISNGLDPWNHRSLENWIGLGLGSPLELAGLGSRRHPPSSKQRLCEGINKYKIDDIAKIEGWEKLEQNTEDHYSNALDEKISYRKDHHELNFYLDTCHVESLEIYHYGSSNRKAKQTLINNPFLMKHVPTIFADPTNKDFDIIGQKNLIGVVKKWKKSYGFVNTYYRRHGGGLTWGYVKDEFFLHKAEFSSDLNNILSSRGRLYDTKVIFDTEPTKDKLDRAVNVRLWDGMDTTTTPVDNNDDDNNNIVTPSPRKKRRTSSQFPWFQDELLIDREEKAEEELQEAHLYEHLNKLDEEELELEGLVNLYYSYAEEIEDKLLIDRETAEEELQEEHVYGHLNKLEEEELELEGLVNLYYSYAEEIEDKLLIDRETAEEELQEEHVYGHLNKLEEEEVELEGLVDLYYSYAEEIEDELLIDREKEEKAEEQLQEEHVYGHLNKLEEEELELEGLVDLFHSFEEKQFPWFEDELLIDREKAEEELQEEHLYELEVEKREEEVELEGLVDLFHSFEDKQFPWLEDELLIDRETAEEELQEEYLYELDELEVEEELELEGLVDLFHSSKEITSQFPWFEDELSIDRNRAEEELQEEHFYEHLYELEEVELEGLVDLYYSSDENFVVMTDEDVKILLEGREDVENRLRQEEEDDQLYREICRKFFEEYVVVDNILDYQEKEMELAVEMYYDNINSNQRTHLQAVYNNDSSNSVTIGTESNNFGKCIFCQDANKTHMFSPCGHLCLCEPCTKEWQMKYHQRIEQAEHDDSNNVNDNINDNVNDNVRPCCICPICKQDVQQAIRVIVPPPRSSNELYFAML